MAEQIYFDGFEPPPRKAGPIEAAVVAGDDLEAVNQVLIKCARTMDSSDSGREVKALSISLFEGIALRRDLSGAGKESSEGGGGSGADVLRLIQGRRADRVANA